MAEAAVRESVTLAGRAERARAARAFVTGKPTRPVRGAAPAQNGLDEALIRAQRNPTFNLSFSPSLLLCM
jgi:hypothetical protein